MSNQTTTSWILNLVDKMTKPLKNAYKSANSLSDAMDDVTSSVARTEKEAKEALENAQGYFNDTKKTVKQLEAELKDLEKAYQEAAPGHQQLQAQEAYEKAKAKVERYREALRGAEEDVDDLNDAVQRFDERTARWQDTIMGVNQGLELLQKANDSMSFAVDIANYTTEVQRLTQLGGDALDEFVTKAMRLRKLEGADPTDLLIAANAMTQFNGGSLVENLDLIEQGYHRGANAQGDFLDQMHEYQPFIKQLGMTNDQYVALITNANKLGVFSDKAIDAMKEANLSLREMQKPQLDALKGIGIDYEKDLMGKSTFEAVQLISAKMKTATTQARQLVMADIFKGAGEDASIQFVEELSTMNLDLTSLPSVERSASGFKSWLSDLATSAGQTFGNIATYSQELMPMVMVVSGSIPIFNMLSKVTWLNTIATKAWVGAQTVLNAVMNANPIVRIITIITALIGVVVWAWNTFEGFRTVIFKTWEGMKLFGKVLKEYVINYIKEIIRSIGYLAKAFQQLFEGDFSGAFGSTNKAIKGFLGFESGQEAGKSFAEGYDDAMTAGQKSSELYTYNKNQKKGASSPNVSVNSLLGSTPETLGGLTPEETGGKGKGKKGGSATGDGLSVGGGTNGIKSIAMTLNITNNFSVAKDTNVRDIADKVVSYINDGMRDAVINIG